MQDAETGVLTPAEETRSLIGEQQPARRGRGGIRTPWPDWTPEQVAILQEAGRRYKSVHGKNISWKRALQENPRWQEILLAGGRPFYHLWHTSAEILSGRRPTRPGAGKKMGLSQRRTPLASRKAGGLKAWETRRQNAVNQNAQVERQVAQQPAAVKFARVGHCPECGANLTPYHRAKELTQ